MNGVILAASMPISSTPPDKSVCTKAIYLYGYILHLMTQLLVEMPEDIHKKFKQVTLADDKSMAEIVRGCVDKYIAEKTKTVVY